MAYDQKCYDLAALFLSDVQFPVKHEDADRLAQEIQRTIEDFLEELSPPDVERDVPPVIQAMIDNDVQVALRTAKAWDQFFDTMFTPRKPT